jgi:RNA polymerase sigma-70 factor (ECF subfamily)
MDEQTDTREEDQDQSEQLVRSVLAGDDRAFDQLVLIHKRFVFNLCYRLLGDYDDADDCAQEVFIKVFRSLESFRFESSFKTWLYRVAANTCKNRLRSLEYRLGLKRVRLDMTEDENQKAPEIANHTQSPSTAFKRKEIGRLIQEAIGKLPTDQRLVVVLRDMEGRSYEEIIEITGLRLGTLKSKLSRARLKLRESLKGAI